MMSVLCRRLHDEPVEMRRVAGTALPTGGTGPAAFVCPECRAQVPTSVVAASERDYQDTTVTVVDHGGRVWTTQRANLR